MEQKAGYIDTKSAAGLMKISVSRMTAIIRDQLVAAEKVHGRWRIQEKSLKRFLHRNQKQIEKLKEYVVAEYWKGRTVKSLEKEIKEKLIENDIVTD